MQLGFVKRALSEANIPFIEGSKDFWDQSEIKAAVMLLRLLVNPFHAGDSLLSCLQLKSSFNIPLLNKLGTWERFVILQPLNSLEMP